MKKQITFIKNYLLMFIVIQMLSISYIDSTPMNSKYISQQDSVNHIYYASGDKTSEEINRLLYFNDLQGLLYLYSESEAIFYLNKVTKLKDTIIGSYMPNESIQPQKTIPYQPRSHSVVIFTEADEFKEKLSNFIRAFHWLQLIYHGIHISSSCSKLKDESGRIITDCERGTGYLYFSHEKDSSEYIIRRMVRRPLFFDSSEDYKYEWLKEHKTLSVIDSLSNNWCSLVAQKGIKYAREFNVSPLPKGYHWSQ